MDEPCDWDVCTEAATPGPISQRSTRTEKKRRVKPVTDPRKNVPAPTRGARGEEKQREVSPSENPARQIPPRVGPTRKELQETLPKIPPLSSFKSCTSTFVTFEEAERDFHSFITTGPGRSVDVIREFRGQEEGEERGHREFVTLHDDAAVVKKPRKMRKSDLPQSGLMSVSSSSPFGKDGAECRAVKKTQVEVSHSPTVREPMSESAEAKARTASPQIHPQRSCTSNGRTSPQPESHKPERAVKSYEQPNHAAPTLAGRAKSEKAKEKVEKKSQKVSEKANIKQKAKEQDGEREDDDYDYDDDDYDEEEEWSAEAYWRASHRAWIDYYASVSPYQGQAYQSCYGTAHNWMAAYRMNAVYMQELLRD